MLRISEEVTTDEMLLYSSIYIILHQEQTIQKLKENGKHGLHFKFCYQFRKFNYSGWKLPRRSWAKPDEANMHEKAAQR